MTRWRGSKSTTTSAWWLCGEGGNFSAGQDLKKFFRELERNPGERKKAAAAANRWRWERLYNYDKPTIAMVHGFCVGGAFMQLLGCDFAIAAENATFSLSEVNWGILPGALVSKCVADAVLPRAALYYACLGEPFDGKEAARIGMINYAVPADKLEDAVADLAQRLMKKSPAVLRATKHAIRHVRTMDVPQAYDYLAAKGQAIKVADKEDSYNTGLRQFLDEKTYKPTFEPFKLGTMLTDQRSTPAKIARRPSQGSSIHDRECWPAPAWSCLPPSPFQIPPSPSSTRARRSP
jgi:trans-feruloyl-CoA hydratase/vanillin synthase